MKSSTQTLTDMIASQSEQKTSQMTLVDDEVGTTYDPAPSGARLLQQRLHEAAVASFFRRAD